MQANMMTTTVEPVTQERGCYTVEELMDILCVGRKAIPLQGSKNVINCF